LPEQCGHIVVALDLLIIADACFYDEAAYPTDAPLATFTAGATHAAFAAGATGARPATASPEREG